MKNILVVTGGAGFVGSNLIKLLLKKTNHKIISIDDYSSGSKKNHINNSRIKYFKSHTKNISSILNKPKNINAIFHFGEFARIYQKGMSNQLLDEVEKLQFSQFINRWVALAESVIVVAKAELMFAGDYDLDFLYGNPYMHKLLKTEVGERWFKEEAPLLYSEDYLMKVASFKNSMESDLTLEE